MSTTLPSPKTQSPDFIGGLIDDQQSLTAVERFSALHEAAERGHSSPELPAQAKYYRNLLPASPPSDDQQYAFEVDLDQCSGCKACVVACHTLNGLEDDEAWRRVGTLTIGVIDEKPQKLPADTHTASPLQPDAESKLSLPMVQHVTTACHHCEDPGCLNGCPVKAYDKDPKTGIVRHLDDQCIGCKYCTMMCPYEVPQYSERLGIVRKCDMCHQRLAVGEAPACVQACPNEAIAITVVARGQVFDDHSTLAPGAPLSSITQPTTRYVGRDMHGNTAAQPPAGSPNTAIPQDLAVPQNLAIPQDQGVDQVAESHWPLAAMLIATQISVGMILIERLVTTLVILTGGTVAEALVRWNATVSLIIAGVGMNLAPLHLGQPLRAWRVFLGLRTSWLSREAVILGKYVGILAAAVGLLWMPTWAPWAPTALVSAIPQWADKAALGLSIPVGIAGLYSSAMIYIVTRRHLWRSTRTLVRFFGTAAIGGGAFAAAAFAYAEHGRSAALLAVVVCVAMTAKVVYEWRILFAANTTADPFDKRSGALVRKRLARWPAARMAAAAIGGVVLVVGGALASVTPIAATALLCVGAIAITAGESLERLLYFKSVVYDRMPGTLE